MWPDFGLTEGVLTLIRAIASIGGAVVGWFVCDPLTRLLYRISFRSATPGWLLPWAKISGALGLAASIWFLIGFGGGGGLGWGAGMGGGPGKGSGQGGNDVPASAVKDAKSKEKKNNPPSTTARREPVDIGWLGGKEFRDDGRNFLVKRPGQAKANMSYAELDEYLKKERDKIQVNVVPNEESAGIGPLDQVRTLTSQYKIPMVEPEMK